MHENKTKMHKAQILIIDDEDSIRQGFGGLLQSKGYATLEAETGVKGLAMMRNHAPDLVLLDLKLPDMEGIELLRSIRSENEFTVVIMITGFGTIDLAVKALKQGAENFLTKPVDPESFLIIVEHALETHRLRRKEVVDELMKKGDQENLFVGQSNKMLKFQELSNIVARDSTVTVLIQGETGTGKGKWAQWIHSASERSSRPFVELNCAGLSKELLESELFGYEKGAFTGAVGSKPGLLEIANGGTLFLDEIAEMELPVQAKLLKVLDEKKFRRLGAVNERFSDVRLIAATNKDLEKAVKEGRFREDLFFRLNVMPLDLPPLRDRKEDIGELADYFLIRMSKQKSSSLPDITKEAKQVLASYSWPGNIRELRNVLERAFLLCKGNTIDTDLLPIEKKVSVNSVTQDFPMVPLREIEIRYMRQVLAAVNNNHRKAAEILGINRNTLYNRLREG